jgi:hypothetical protein
VLVFQPAELRAILPTAVMLFLRLPKWPGVLVLGSVMLNKPTEQEFLENQVLKLRVR